MESDGGIFSISEVNAFESEQFEWVFGNVVENHPEASRHVAYMIPFDNREDLKRNYDAYLENLSDEDKEQILLKHPDLGGRLAEDAKPTSESITEQKSAGLHEMTKEDKETLTNLANTYREKYQFPFVICVRENTINTIISTIESRLKNSRETELEEGIQEVKKIVRMRIDDLVWADE